DLVGSSVGDLSVSTSSELTWHLDLGSDLITSERPPGMVQTYLSGRIHGVSDDSDVLIVVNGRVSGVGYMVRDSLDGARFSGVISEQFINDGPNQIDVLVPAPGGVWLSGTVADL